MTTAYPTHQRKSNYRQVFEAALRLGVLASSGRFFSSGQTIDFACPAISATNVCDRNTGKTE